MIRVILRPEARQDLGKAKAWYRKISPELANDFVRRIDVAIALACERPLAFPIVHRTFRRVLLDRFPYALFYHPGKNQIVVVAILHQARDPEIIASRRV
jgi:toxin ParE1/3/4